FGLFAPNGTPDAIVRRLNTDVQSVFSDPDFKAKFLDPHFLGVIAGTPAEFSAYISKEADKWKKVLKDANVKVD
ncbi:MAG TPA: tripartite tricarboxylate transporter substrate-binding protein, partial [Gemmatimonadaceae bacterium]